MSPSPSCSHSITLSPLPPKKKITVLKKKRSVTYSWHAKSDDTTAMASALFERRRLWGEGRMALRWHGYQTGTRNSWVVQRASAGGSKPAIMQILMNVHSERSLAHIRMYMDTHACGFMHTDVHTREDNEQKGQYIYCLRREGNKDF